MATVVCNIRIQFQTENRLHRARTPVMYNAKRNDGHSRKERDKYYYLLCYNKIVIYIVVFHLLRAYEWVGFCTFRRRNNFPYRFRPVRVLGKASPSTQLYKKDVFGWSKTMLLELFLSRGNVKTGNPPSP